MPKTTAQLTEDLAETYLRIEDELLANISRRFNVNDIPDDITKWRIDKLNELGGLRRENLKIISRLTGKAESQITEIVKQAAFERIEVDEVIYREAVKDGAITAAMPAKASKAINKVLTNYAKSAVKDSVIIHTKALQSSNKAFIDIVNQAYLQTSLGVTDYQTAIKSAVTKLADNGITGIDYKTDAGKNIKYHLDTAMRRNIISTSSKAAADSQLARADEYGVDLVEVTSYAGARPSHAEWQGKIYSKSGKTKGYASFYTSTGYGKVDGLGGANCGHTFFPYIPGVSERVNYPIDKEKNDKAYAESQEQRKLEREVREQKRRIITASGAGDEVGLKRAQLKLKAKEKEVKAFTARTGRTLRNNRQQVDKFGRSQAQKAVHAAKKAG